MAIGAGGEMLALLADSSPLVLPVDVHGLPEKCAIFLCENQRCGSGIVLMSIHTWILPQVLHTLENHKFYLTFIHISASLNCFIFFFSVLGVIIYSILNRIIKFSGKSFV